MRLQPIPRALPAGLSILRSGANQPRHSLIQFTNIARLVCVVLTHQKAQELISIRRAGQFGSPSIFSIQGLPKLLVLESNERQHRQQRELLGPAFARR